MATGEKPILFGNLSYFVRREVLGSVRVKVFVERYAESGKSATSRTSELMAS